MNNNPILKYCLSTEAKRAGIKLGIPRAQDAGFDLPSLHDLNIPPSGFVLVSTGVHLAIPPGWVGLLRDRSSVALRGGAVTAGVIDSSYRGEVRVAMHNLSLEPLVFQAGERIAQLLVVPHLEGGCSEEVELCDQLGESERGQGGFGSTGRY